MVSRWTGGDLVEDKVHDDEVGGSDADYPKTSNESFMHIDDAHPSVLEETNEGLDSDSEGDEEADPSDVAMVPMADLLNARWGSENVSRVLSCFVFFFFRFV